LGIEVLTVERLIWRYWKLEKTSSEEQNSIAVDILDKAQRATSLEQLKLELEKIQVNRLRHALDTRANDEIATRVFAAAHA
jgi:hypothetical protein